MELKSKLNNIKNGFKQLKADLRDADYNDLTKFYKKILKKIPDISHLKNIVLFSGLASLIVLIMFAQRLSSLEDYLPTKPDFGGSYSEGVVGEIKQLNPLYAPTNNAETMATSLIFSGLTKHGPDRNVIPDLAERWDISSDGQLYTFYLRENIHWQDGEKLTAEDVAFTFSKIQDPDVESPYFSTWKGVEVTAVDVRTVVFRLPESYGSFLYLTNMPIVPRHILGDIPSSSLKAAEFSQDPIGTGPYIFDELKELKDRQELILLANQDYFIHEPYISKFSIKTYQNYNQLVDAYNRRDVLGIERLAPEDLNRRGELPNINTYDLSVPEYDNLVFNLKNEPLKDKNLRLAINSVIDRGKIIKDVYGGQAIPIYGAILPGFPGYNKAVKSGYNLKTAASALKSGGYKKGTDNILRKDGTEVSLRLISLDSGLKSEEASLIAEMIRGLGIKVELERFPINTYLEEYVRTRNYDMLLVTQNLGPDSDLYAYYHEKMINDPGLNFSGISNREIDKYLEEARVSLNKKERTQRYQAVAKILNSEIVGVYLCWPSYLFGVSKDVSGVGDIKVIEPKDKYYNVIEWHINTRRAY